MKNFTDLLEGLVDDEAKARVLETHIKATEETKRAQVVRGMGMAVLAAMVAGSTCVGYRMVEGWQSIHTPVSPVACTESVIDTSKTVGSEIRCPDPGQRLTYPPGWTWAKCSCPDQERKAAGDR